MNESVLVAIICVITKPHLVLMALVMTIGIVLAISLYALTTEKDFTMMGGALFLVGMAFLLVGICLHFTHNKTLHVIFSAAAVVFLGFYLIYDL